MKPYNVSARPTETFGLYLHVPTDEVFAFRFALPEMRVTGLAGPRSQLQWQRVAIVDLDYDADPARLSWATDNLRDFDLAG